MQGESLSWEQACASVAAQNKVQQPLGWGAALTLHSRLCGLGRVPTLQSLPCKARKQSSLCLPWFRGICLVASKGNYIGLAWAMKGKFGKQLDRLLRPCPGIWLGLRSPWDPGLVSSQLTLWLSPLLFSGHLLFPSLLWTPWQKLPPCSPRALLTQWCLSRQHEYPILSPFLLALSSTGCLVERILSHNQPWRRAQCHVY